MIEIERNFNFGIELEIISKYSSIELLEEFSRKTKLPIRAVSRSHSDYTTWLRKNDGSISVTAEDMEYLKTRNLYTHEIVSPILSHATISQLKAVAQFLSEGVYSSREGLKVPVFTFNESCGLHITADTRGYTEAQKESTYNLFKTLEPQIMMLVPPLRRENLFCQSVKGIKYFDRIKVDKYYSIHIKNTINAFEYRLFYMKFYINVIMMFIYILDSIHLYGKSHNIPYLGTFNLEKCLKNTTLCDILHNHRTKVQTMQNKLLTIRDQDKEKKITLTSKRMIPVISI